MVDVVETHIRVIVNGDLEYKCNKAVKDELALGCFLFNIGCSMSYGSKSEYDQDCPQYLIILAFKKG